MLFGPAGTIMLGEWAPGVLQPLAGSAFLGGLGLGFAAIYLTRREFWWAMIPAGKLLIVGAVAAISEGHAGGRLSPESVFFMGFGFTFFLVALSSTAEGNARWWACIPAGVMFLIGFLVFAHGSGGQTVMQWVWPAALILVGAILLLRGLGSKPA